MSLGGELTSRAAAAWRFRAGQQPRWRVQEPVQERVLLDLDRSCAMPPAGSCQSDSDSEFQTRCKLVLVPFNVGDGNVGRQRDLYYKYFFGGVPSKWHCDWHSERKLVDGDTCAVESECGSHGAGSFSEGGGGSQAACSGESECSSQCMTDSGSDPESFIVADGSQQSSLLSEPSPQTGDCTEWRAPPCTPASCDSGTGLSGSDSEPETVTTMSISRACTPQSDDYLSGGSFASSDAEDAWLPEVGMWNGE